MCLKSQYLTHRLTQFHEGTWWCKDATGGKKDIKSGIAEWKQVCKNTMQDEKSQPMSPLGCCNNSLWCGSIMRKSRERNGEKTEQRRQYVFTAALADDLEQEEWQHWMKNCDGCMETLQLWPLSSPMSPLSGWFFWMCCVMQSYSFKCHFLCPNFPTFLIIFLTEKLSHCLWGLFIPPAALNSDRNFLSRFQQFSFHLCDFIAFQHIYHARSMSSPSCSFSLLLNNLF